MSHPSEEAYTKTIELPWGGGETLPLQIPPTWQIIAHSQPVASPPIADLLAAVQEGLRQPIGLPPLRHLVGPEARIALVMDDGSRPTPVHRLAPAVLNMLLAAGACSDNVTGLFAVGSHRPMSSEEMMMILFMAFWF